MKIILITRVFSGLLESIEKGKWKPYGIPAIYKLIEECNKREIELDVLLLAKTTKESITLENIEKIKIKELSLINFYIFKYHALGVNSSKIKLCYNDFIQFCIIFFKFYLKKKYDLFYFDRANIVFAAFFSLLGTRTVVRFLGIANLKFFLDKLTYILYSPLAYLSLKIPYSLVICSEDGSPSRMLFEKCLNNKTPCSILLNGVKIKNNSIGREVNIRSKYDFKEDYPVFLFVGRLKPDKGYQELIEVLIRLKNISKKFYCIIIAGGSDFADIKENMISLGLGKYIKFERVVEHADINDYYEQADVYISLNKLGNLSNTVLEAMAAGKCIVMLGKDEKTHTDETTENMVPSNVVIRINRDDFIHDLTNKLEDLIDNPEKIKIYSDRMKKFAKRFLWSWEERINYELKLLETVAEGKTIE